MKNMQFILYIMAGLIVFYIDTITPLGYAPWFLYIVLIFFYTTYSNKKYILVLSLFYAALLIPGYFLSPQLSPDINVPVFNRLAAIVILIILAVLGMREETAKKISTEVLDRIGDFFFAVDRKFRVTFMNRSAKEFAKINHDITGDDVFEVFPVLKNELSSLSFGKAINTRQHIHYQLNIPSTETVLDIALYGSDKGLSILASDVTQKMAYEKKLMNLLQEKEMLMKEMHHRTKNNFQLVLSLLNLQINSIQDQLSKNILNETRARLLSITLLYDKLFRSGEVYTVDMNTFISDIVSNMDTAVNFGILKMQNELKIESARIGIDAAIPLGLIINELYTNSLKYAFNGNRTGSVYIEMYFTTPSTLRMIYKDNGKGLPDGFSLDRGGLGSSIISGFVDQLEGEVKYRNNHGAEFELNLRIVKNLKTVEIPKEEVAEIIKESGS